MLFTLQVGLEDLKKLPLDMRQKIQQALDLPSPAQPVQTPAPMPVQQWTQSPQQTGWQSETAGPPAMFAPPQFQAPPAAPAFPVPPQPAKQAVVQNGVPTFAADRSGPTAQSVFRDVLTGQTGQVPVAPGGPVVPQVDSVAAPPSVAPIGAPQGIPAAMAAPTAATVRAAAVKAYNSGSKDAVNAAMGETGINIAGLTDQNAGTLANALRQKGVPV